MVDQPQEWVGQAALGEQVYLFRSGYVLGWSSSSHGWSAPCQGLEASDPTSSLAHKVPAEFGRRGPFAEPGTESSLGEKLFAGRIGRQHV